MAKIEETNAYNYKWASNNLPNQGKMKNKYPAINLGNKILGKSISINFSTINPSPLTYLEILYCNPFWHELLAIQIHEPEDKR